MELARCELVGRREIVIALGLLGVDKIMSRWGDLRIVVHRLPKGAQRTFWSFGEHQMHN